MTESGLRAAPVLTAPIRRASIVVGVALFAAMVGLAATDGQVEDLEFLGFAAAGALITVLVGVQWVFSERALRTARSAQEAESAQLEQMFTGSRLGLALMGVDGHVLRVNPALCAMLGYTADEVIGRTVADFTHPDDLDLTARLYDELRNGGDGFDCEKRYLAKDGRVTWAHTTVSVTFDSLAGDRLLIVQVQDISKRKRAEIALAEERHLLDQFLTNIPEQVYFKDSESHFLRVSRLQATRLGVEHPDLLIGKTDFDVFGVEHASRTRADELEVMRTGVPIIEHEERETQVKPDGSEVTRWVMTTKMPLHDAGGAIIGTFGVSRDITLRKRAEAALRESEARWRTLLSHLQEIVVLVDAERRLTYATPSMERWLGYSPDELVGIDLASTGHPDDSSKVQGALRSVTSDHPVSITHRVRHKDGSWHTLESTLVRLRHDPIMQAVLFASTDITDRIALEEDRERLDLERRVSHRLEAVGQLAAGIAHEINTPLQFVGDSVTFLQDAVEELLNLTGRYRELLWTDTPIPVEERRASLAEAEQDADLDYLLGRIPAAFARTTDGVDRVRSIVQAMKRFSHPATSDVAPADLHEAIETTLAVCRNEYKYVADIALDLQEMAPVPCNIGEINQVLLNLIVNAAQALEEQRQASPGITDPHPPGVISIATRVDDDSAVIVIADNGPGIPPHLQERIYEPFFTTKEVGKGTGQGLALARTIVDRHHGSLECDSTVNVGTTFTLRLPLGSAGESD